MSNTDAAWDVWNRDKPEWPYLFMVGYSAPTLALSYVKNHDDESGELCHLGHEMIATISRDEPNSKTVVYRVQREMTVSYLVNCCGEEVESNVVR